MDNNSIKQQRDREFENFRKGVKAHLPNLSQRVFALRRVHYTGCGFHYNLERELGSVIAGANTYHNCFYGEDGIAERIIFEVLVANIFDQLMRIESGIDHG